MSDSGWTDEVERRYKASLEGMLSLIEILSSIGSRHRARMEAAKLDKKAEWLYLTLARASGNPEPWNNITDKAKDGWRAVAQNWIDSECETCGDPLVCINPNCDELKTGSI